nr:uncharacterized protein LOC117680408 [Crassostrea gigas]
MKLNTCELEIISESTMVWIKRFFLALLVCSNLITFSVKCELAVTVADQIICLKQAFSIYQSYFSCNGGRCPPHQNFTAECNSVCSNTTSANDTTCTGPACPIVLLFVVDNKKHLVNTTGKNRLKYTTQETTQKSITSLVSKYVNETSRITQKTTQRIELESTPVVGNTTLIQEFPINETLTQRYCDYDCTSNTGVIVGSAFIGLFAGVLLTGSISFFLLKRRTQSLKIPAVTHPLYNLNGREASLCATAGETYNEIENDSHSPKISYVLPITKDEAKSSVSTNNPEIYHHLREDYDVKDRSNYYDPAVPLNGPQEIESDQYGKLAIEENGAYSTVTNMNKTGTEPVRNEAYSKIETSEFQLVEVEGNNDNSASNFVLTKE